MNICCHGDVKPNTSRTKSFFKEDEHDQNIGIVSSGFDHFKPSARFVAFERIVLCFSFRWCPVAESAAPCPPHAPAAVTEGGGGDGYTVILPSPHEYSLTLSTIINYATASSNTGPSHKSFTFFTQSVVKYVYYNFFFFFANNRKSWPKAKNVVGEK